MISVEKQYEDIFRKVEHIGIAVADLEAADKIYSAMLGVERYKVEDVPGEGVRTAFYRVGDVKIELLEAVTRESAIARFIEKRGPGLHHIAYDVADIRKSMERLKKAGFTFTADAPFPGADHKLVCFIHPKSTGGTLVELCQDIDESTPL